MVLGRILCTSIWISKWLATAVNAFSCRIYSNVSEQKKALMRITHVQIGVQCSSISLFHKERKSPQLHKSSKTINFEWWKDYLSWLTVSMSISSSVPAFKRSELSKNHSGFPSFFFLGRSTMTSSLQAPGITRSAKLDKLFELKTFKKLTEWHLYNTDNLFASRTTPKTGTVWKQA